jgi:hypothetical protein
MDWPVSCSLIKPQASIDELLALNNSQFVPLHSQLYICRIANWGLKELKRLPILTMLQSATNSRYTSSNLHVIHNSTSDSGSFNMRETPWGNRAARIKDPTTISFQLTDSSIMQISSTWQETPPTFLSHCRIQPQHSHILHTPIAVPTSQRPITGMDGSSTLQRITGSDAWSAKKNLKDTSWVSLRWEICWTPNGRGPCQVTLVAAGTTES